MAEVAVDVEEGGCSAAVVPAPALKVKLSSAQVATLSTAVVLVSLITDTCPC